MNENEAAVEKTDEVSKSLEHADSEFKGTYETMLTTSDNPFDPFDRFDDWFAFDEQKGYHTCSYLARIARISNGISDDDNERTIEEAIDEIIALNITGNYKKVKRSA